MNKTDIKALFGDIDPTSLSQEELDRYVAKWNDRPIDDFCGLSPVQMDVLLNDPLGSSSPIRVRRDIDQDVFERIPFFRLVEELLTIISREEEIQLTGTGALPPRFVRELYEMRLLPQYDIERGISKLSKELDWMALQAALIVASSAGIIRKANKKMRLTRKGTAYLEDGVRRDLFIEVLRTFTDKLNWAYFDGYESDEIGRFGWGYTTFLLLLFGEKPRPVTYYAELYRRAFPMLYSEEKSSGLDPTPPFDRFVQCYGLRSFSRFLSWFGCVEADLEWRLRDKEDIVTVHQRFREIFETDGVQP